jgi:hypothetical protein
MSPAKQRIAIAKACGWTEESWRLSAIGWLFADAVPDYLNDLNAMHEAENSLTEAQRIAYSDYLYDMASEHQINTGQWRYLSMNAAQRAEAFLRTIGRWESP